MLAPIASILAIANPLATPPWLALKSPLTPTLAWAAFFMDDIEARHAEPIAEGATLDAKEHAQRIAWLMKNPGQEVIRIDTSRALRGLWPVVEGNHQLYANILRGYPMIEVEYKST